MLERDLRYLEYEINRKKIYIVKHHPVVLKCWKKAYEEGRIKKGSTLLHIDKHPDFTFLEKNLESSRNILRLSEEELDNFIKNELKLDNSEFIVNSMISGLIGDGISIYFDSLGFYGTYKSREYDTTDKYYFEDKNIRHTYYSYETETLLFLFGSHSLLNDSCIHQDTNELYLRSKYLILDIDLDFFTYDNDGIFAKNSKDIKRQIESQSFQNLYSKANIITIALEPDFCGSIKDTIEILEVFYELIFKLNKINLVEDVAKFFFT